MEILWSRNQIKSSKSRVSNINFKGAGFKYQVQVLDVKFKKQG